MQPVGISAWLLYAAAVIVPVALLTLTAAVDRMLTIRSAEGSAVTTLDLLAAEVAGVLQTASAMLAMAEIAIGNRDDAALRIEEPALEDALSRAVALSDAALALVVFSADGEPVIDSERGRGGADFSVEQRRFFRQLRDGVSERLTVSVPIESRAYTSERVFVAARRLAGSDGGFAGIVSVGIPTAYFLDRWGSAVTAEASATIMVRQDGAILVRSPEPEAEAPESLDDDAPMMRVIRGIEERAVLRSDSPIDGTDRIFAAQRVGRYPLWVGYGVSTRTALAPWRRRLAGYATVGAAIVPVLLLLVGLLDRRTRTLAATADELAKSEAMLERLNRELEERVASRTLALERALSAKDLLLKEVNHRVMNSLSLAGSLVRLQRRQLGETHEAAVALRETEHRLLALGKVHARLYRGGDVQSVDLAGYLEDLVAEMADIAGRVRIAGNFEGIRVPTDVAVKLGIIVTELLLNALKHAFSPGEDGKVTASFTRAGSGWRLTVEDDGRGLPEAAPRPASLGMVVVESLAKDLGAEVSVERLPRGTRVAVTAEGTEDIQPTA